MVNGKWRMENGKWKMLCVTVSGAAATAAKHKTAISERTQNKNNNNGRR